ncbi:putative wall-associated receptor kinase-like 16 isoform X1 [Fagus crenata]
MGFIGSKGDVEGPSIFGMATGRVSYSPLHLQVGAGYFLVPPHRAPTGFIGSKGDVKGPSIFGMATGRVSNSPPHLQVGAGYFLFPPHRAPAGSWVPTEETEYLLRKPYNDCVGTGSSSSDPACYDSIKNQVTISILNDGR